ncbi:MAG: fasciclin domain-containing protein [Polyangiales bacterium]
MPDSAMAADSNNVIAIVANTPEYSSMWSVVTAADMRDELYERREVKTVFVPTNDAFAALGQSTIDNLLLEENRAQLDAIIASHIIDGSVTAPELAAGGFAANNLGDQLTSAKDDTGATTVQGARVIRSIRADDGYVHVIDAVIIPVQ